jgi:hypothetical protein
MPELVFTLDGVSEEIQKAVAALPSLSDGPERYAGRLQYDSETRCVRLPLIGGPSMEPAAGMFGRTLLVSSSRTVAETLVKGGPREEKLPQPANVWIRMQPRPCLEAVVNAARLLAENDLLKDYSPETLQDLAAPWLGSASVVQEIAGFAAYDKGRITAEARLVCTRQPIAASSVKSPDLNGPSKS